MKIILLSLSFIAVVSLCCFCKHQPRFAADNLPTQQLHWGAGGGYVGKESAHILLNNGQIFKRELAGALVETAKVKSKKAAAIFKTAQALDFSNLEFNHPGNIYSFLEWQDGDVVHRIVWGDPNFPIDGNVKALYDRLNGLLKQ